ncbi:MAG TPA: ATP-binding protein [Mycobacteriales bacterium]
MAEPGPTHRRTDLVLMALLLTFTTASIVLSGLDTGQIVAGIAITVVELAAVPLRRTRPRTALAVLAVPAALGYAVLAPTQSLVWAVVAFVLARGPVRSGWLLTLAVLGVAAVSGAGYTLRDGDVAAGVGYAITIGFSVGAYTAVGAVLGLISRAVRAREETRRRSEERARTAAALAVQRTRIADELGSGVLDGLRRLTERTTALDDGDAVPALERDAREVLSRMRRALTALREEGPDPDRPPRGPADRDGRSTPWQPTRRGLALSAAFGFVALGVAALPLRPIGQVSMDRSLPLLDLPWSTPAAMVSLAVQVLAVAWWRSAPMSAFAVATVAAIATGSLGGTNAFIEASWMFLVYAVGVGAPPRRSGVLTAAGTLAVLVAYLTVPAMNAEISADAAGIVLSYLVVPFLWFAGVRRRDHRRYAETLRSERHEAERRETLERERLRVAHELHDVVAHHVSAIAVQAGAARVTTDPAARREALGHIAESGRRIADALPELETLTPDPGGVALTADGVEELVRPVRAAGVPVTCAVRGDPAGPPGDPELFAQRILTEALTNVVRHAGASDTRVLVEHRPDAVTVEVADAGPAPGYRGHTHGSGLGTAGMHERARMLGGHVRVGPGPDGGWRVHALLPRSAASPGVLLREEDHPVSISSPTTTRPATGLA